MKATLQGKKMPTPCSTHPWTSVTPPLTSTSFRNPFVQLDKFFSGDISHRIDNPVYT